MSRPSKKPRPVPEVLAPVSDAILNQFAPEGMLTAAEVEAATRRFKKALLERALGAELGHHLAQEGDGTFAPVLIPTHQRRFTGFDDQILALYARGLTVRFAFPPDIRRTIYTTNALENVNRQIRKATKTRGHFPTDAAAIKLIWLAIRNLTARWSRGEHHWKTAMNQFAASHTKKLTAPERTRGGGHAPPSIPQSAIRSHHQQSAVRPIPILNPPSSILNGGDSSVDAFGHRGLQL